MTGTSLSNSLKIPTICLLLNLDFLTKHPIIDMLDVVGNTPFKIPIYQRGYIQTRPLAREPWLDQESPILLWE